MHTATHSPPPPLGTERQQGQQGVCLPGHCIMSVTSPVDNRLPSFIGRTTSTQIVLPKEREKQQTFRHASMIISRGQGQGRVHPKQERSEIAALSITEAVML